SLVDVFGEQGNVCEGDARGVFDRVQDCGGGSVHRKLANAFRAEGAVDAGRLLERNVDRWKIGAGGHDVVGHLGVGEVTIAPDALFVERVADGLCDAAFDLSFGKDGMEDAAYLLHSVKVCDGGSVGCRIDRDLGDIGGPGVGGVGVASKVF